MQGYAAEFPELSTVNGSRTTETLSVTEPLFVTYTVIFLPSFLSPGTPIFTAREKFDTGMLNDNGVHQINISFLPLITYGRCVFGDI